MGLRLTVPSGLRGGVEPIIVGDMIYLLHADGIYRLDLRDASTELIVDDPALARWSSGLASDGSVLYAATAEVLVAYSLEGDRLWEASVPPLTTVEDSGHWCAAPAAARDVVVVHCHQRGGTAPAAEFLWAEGVPFVAAFETSDGALRWIRPSGSDAATSAMSLGISIVAGRAIATRETAGTNEVLAFDLLDAEDNWSRLERARLDEATRDPQPPEQAELRSQQSITGDAHSALPLGEEVLVRLDTLQLVEADSGRTVWAAPFHDGTMSNAAVTTLGDSLVVAWGKNLRIVSPSDGTARLVATLPADEDWYRVAATQDGFLAYSVESIASYSSRRPNFLLPWSVAPPPDQLTHLYSFDRNGTLRWKLLVETDPYYATFSVAGEALAMRTHPDTILVLGSVPASIQLAIGRPDAYPAPGAPARLDLSASRPGAQSPDVEYRVDWGDGETSDWQTSPLFEHVYATPGDREARVQARNPAGQLAIERVVFHVGAPRPVEPNLVARAFQTENQDRTFFVLGLALTAGAGALGLLRRQRRRSLLARELAALDDVVAGARDDPMRLDRALDERRVHARALLLANRLDEGQHSVLVARIDELSRKERLHIADTLLDFLPHRHVKTLRETLKDGRVSSIERAHFLAAVEADADLSPAQKARAREVVERWAEHDAGIAP